MTAKTTKTARLNALAAVAIDGAQIIYLGLGDRGPGGPGWYVRYASGLIRWIGRDSGTAAEWINNA